MNSPWTVHLFGGLRLERDGQSVSRFRTQKAAALLAYLALYPTRVHSREEIADRFWPEAEPEAGRANLRTTLASLRRQLELGDGSEDTILLKRGRSELVLNTDAFRTDVARFEESLRAAARPGIAREEKIKFLREAAAYYTGPLLPGFYTDWVQHERSRFEGLYLAALEQLSDLLEQSEEWGESLHFARLALKVDPQREKLRESLRRLEEASRGNRVISIPPEDSHSENQHTKTERSHRPLPSGRAVRGQINLPVSLTRFFGREGEIESLREMLIPGRVTRLVTITGPGGSGKTRLALEVAGRLSSEFTGGLCFVGLADVRDPHQVPDRIAASLGLLPTPLISPVDQITAALKQYPSDPALLILDNYEQLVTEFGAEIVSQILADAPNLSCLVTSRQLLQIEEEREFALAPLPVPAHPGTPERLLEFAGVQMFVDRARIARPDFPFNGRNAEAISTLCQKLEGIPLALELVAAWAQTLTAAQMLERLQDRAFRAELLAARRRDISHRHATLKATIGWSYDLLSPELRCFFRQLAVFQGGWTLDAAESVLQEPETLPFLTALRERSLVLAVESGDEMRFQMLETLREFAAERQREDSDPKKTQELRECQAQWCLSLAEEAAPYLAGSAQAQWLDRLQAEQENLRLALTYYLEQDVEAELRLAVALFRFWQARGPIAEAHRWLEDGLKRAVEAPATTSSRRIRAKALECSGTMAWYRSDVELSRTRLEESIALYRELGDGHGIASAINSFAGMQNIASDTKRAQDLLKRGLAEMESLGGQTAVEGRRMLLESLTRDAVLRFDEPDAERYGTEWFQLVQESGDSQRTSAALLWLGYAALNTKNYPLAETRLNDALSRARVAGGVLYSSSALWGLGYLALFEGDVERAAQLQREALRTIYGVAGYDFAVVYIVEAISLVALAARQPARQVARLLGASATLRRGLGYPLTPVLRGVDLNAAAKKVRAELGSRTFEAEYAEGASLPRERVFEEALRDFGSPSSP